jgi:6-phosphogluconolactonase
VSEREIIVAANAAELAQTAASRFVTIVRARQADSGRATTALSGGSTPRALFTLLADEPYATQVDWSTVDVFWGDERTVPPDHADSNYRMAWETLLSKVPMQADHMHRMRGELDPKDAARAYEEELASVFADAGPGHPPAFDLILLGLGPDGHTASLFPGTEALPVRDRLVVANEVPQQGTTRLTFTVPVLLAAKNVMFLVAGPDKADAVFRAVEDDWNPNETPSQFLRQAHGRVIWMLDRAAAARLGDAGDV